MAATFSFVLWFVAVRIHSILETAAVENSSSRAVETARESESPNPGEKLQGRDF